MSQKRHSSHPGEPTTCPRAGCAGPSRNRSRWWLPLYAITGLAALVWFLLRVIPKPSRAAYPCQRVAFPLASSFVLWLLGLAGAVVALRRSRRLLAAARYGLAASLGLVAVAFAIWSLCIPLGYAPADWTPVDAPNAPVGEARGIQPGRVVWVHDPEATSWDGASNYWWTDANTDPLLVRDMLSRAVRRLSGEATDAAAWDSIFRHFNETHGRGERGYRSGEGIAIKINMNVASNYSLTNEPTPSPQVVNALLRQLVEEAGVTESAISVYDASRCITDAIFEPCHRDFPQVRFADNDGRGDRDQVTADAAVRVHYTDPRVGSSGTTRLPACVVESSYLINLALLRGHSLAGVTLCAKNHFGSVWQPNSTTDGGWKPSNLHASIDKHSNAMGSVNSLVDLMGHEHLDGKALLFLIDGLYGAVNQGSSRPSRWVSSPFDSHWTSSLLASQDGVALDSVAVDICRSEPTLEGQVTGQSVDNYLHEAALAHDPPSGATYDPEGDGTPLASLGVHEHWNNATDRQYSRNLGTGDGIELVYVSGRGGFVRGDVTSSGDIDISDAVLLLLHLFAGREAPPCRSSADANDSGSLDMSDAIYLLRFLFLGDDPPPAPFAAGCGDDPTPDHLECDDYVPCAAGPSGERER